MSALDIVLLVVCVAALVWTIGWPMKSHPRVSMIVELVAATVVGNIFARNVLFDLLGL